MLGSMLILIPLSFLATYNMRTTRYRPILQFLFWVFAANFLFLLWLGAKPIAEPYIFLGQISTLIYFSYFILLILIG